MNIYYGPYWASREGRWFVNLRRPDGSMATQTVARAIVEQHLGRQLSTEEHVDHVNEDKTDDRLSNLQVLTCQQNIRKFHGPRMTYRFACPQCGTEKVIPMADYRYSLKKGRTRHCSKRCAWLANH